MPSPRHPTLILVPGEVRSGRLRLRPLQVADAEQVFAAVQESRAELALWLSWPRNILDVEDARDLCIRSAARWSLRTDLGLGIFRASDDRFLGATGLHDPDWRLRAFEMGYWLRTSAVGHGYATEAVQVVLGTAFEQLAAQRVEIRCDPRNVRSRRVPERLGLTLEGHLRHAALDPHGDVRDTLIFAVTPDAYPRLREHWKSAHESWREQ